ncbi:transposon Ty3-I Gag-Pol polyprotein [Trichonephila clavipes]|nr:transposon Ty3-I Gag-Pol polyprotein [Trichonephila clavipes]
MHMLRYQDKDRRRYDSKHQMVSYALGDLVLRRLSAVTYEVQDFDPASRKRKLREVVHILRIKPYHDPAEQIETEDKEVQDIIPPEEPYKGPNTRSRIKTLEENDSGALSSFLRGAIPHTQFVISPDSSVGRELDSISSCLVFKSRPRQIYQRLEFSFHF